MAMMRGRRKLLAVDALTDLKGQFTATRFVENPGVDYPVDLTRVNAASAEQVAQSWKEIKEC
ncbi:hypothetical protein BOP93_11905 [Pseudomonas orientalis]|uniref:Uncharacterized protein n=1 Tax=Pseudomonas orientalis TaxID=76758 RepID=A0A2L0RW64_9PSED|nr:hypothetical protein BOP93_11905 [Pseudomonas orientalis]